MSTLPVTVSARTIVDGCFKAEGEADLGLVYDVAVALGVPEQRVRLAIRRMEASGDLEQLGRGRAGRLVSTAQGVARARLESRLVEFAFAQESGEYPWDQRWRLYAFSIPESERAERDALRAALTQLGAELLAPGLYVTPHDLHAELELALTPEIVGRRLIAASVDSLHLPGCDTNEEIAEQLWPAEAVLAAYLPLEQHLAGSAGARRAEALTGAGHVDVAAQALLLQEVLDQALRADPLLPRELRPKSWKPEWLLREFLAAWSQLQDLAPDLPMFADAGPTLADRQRA